MTVGFVEDRLAVTWHIVITDFLDFVLPLFFKLTKLMNNFRNN